MTERDILNQHKENNRILVVGATSSIARSICRILAEQTENELLLAGRDKQELQLLADDLKTRYKTECSIIEIDLGAENFSAVDLINKAGKFSTLIIAAGIMGNSNQDDIENIKHIAMVNYIAPCQIMTIAADSMTKQGISGTIAVISSVAGNRGRAANYEYGAAKAALSAFASGMRQRYFKKNIHILTIKPGFVDTQMSFQITSKLVAKREKVAADIVTAIKEKKDVLYTPFFWRYIMLIINHIPEALFKKLAI